MTTYFQYNERRTRKPPQKTEHGTEIVDIPSIMVTEQFEQMPRSRAAEVRMATGSRHDWAYCPCAKCRSDRGESE